MKHGYELPDYLNTNIPMIYIVGQKRLVIQNYKKILSYNLEEIILLADQSRIHIRGKDLNIDYFDSDEILIKGRIQSISYPEF